MLRLAMGELPGAELALKRWPAVVARGRGGRQRGAGKCRPAKAVLVAAGLHARRVEVARRFREADSMGGQARWSWKTGTASGRRVVVGGESASEGGVGPVRSWEFGWGPIRRREAEPRLENRRRRRCGRWKKGW